jgi:hypothetical protein
MPRLGLNFKRRKDNPKRAASQTLLIVVYSKPKPCEEFPDYFVKDQTDQTESDR